MPLTPYRHSPDLEYLVVISAKGGLGNVPAVFRAAIAADPTRPLLTFYDDATGERTELSGTTLENWVAKTANLLVDGCGLGPGDLAAVVLPPHWQTAAVLLGAWSAGLTVTYADPVLTEATEPAEVSFVTADRLATAPEAGDRFVLGLAPMALPMREVPAGFVDYVAEVRGHGDHFRPYAPVRDTDPATADGTTQEEYCRAARGLAEARGIGPADRVLVDAAEAADPLTWLLAPLVAGASIVLCANLDPAARQRRLEIERVTRVLS
ncbi:TIGR03089 family protein [Planosporangium flavigriseum]|uniref:TIGR03089 family protein n=1 Tax=Planosporangium flavigriseum TaxID=373681 RepID=A0A8J3PJY8_9ACTN|nr:TIGR03089 family protein [Planosporangium flavigriseum]NJC64921.1 TIGR03089 family protein [Planosporangium flavigriseum]GIG72796.1 TIGR03089 family protein [Planosporangium flavigriseum]